jgi:molybdenum cofactor cytidylyltransferase
MGRLKQLLPWHGSTVVAAAFDALAGHCGAGVVLVAGADADRIQGALEARDLRLVRADSDAEQIESARAGLECALTLPGMQHVLLHPADHPVIPAPVLDALLARADASTALIPTYRQRGGHPILIPSGLGARIVSWRPGAATGGLRGFWQSHPQDVARVEFSDAPGLVMDLDSPRDYESALQGPG